MISVPLLNPKFAIGFAPWVRELRVRGTAVRGHLHWTDAISGLHPRLAL